MGGHEPRGEYNVLFGDDYHGKVPKNWPIPEQFNFLKQWKILKILKTLEIFKNIYILLDKFIYEILELDSAIC